MKKILIGLILVGMISTGLAFADTKYCGIGVRLVKDPYNKKVFVFRIFPDSMAAKTGLPEGAEIISVEGQKVKKMNLDQITNIIRGEEGTSVKLIIKYGKEKSAIEIPRAEFNVPKKAENKFDLHWKQIAPVNANIEPIPQNMVNNMSGRMYREIVPFTNYWLKRKVEFKNSYDVCMSYPTSEQNNCLINLTNREINKTAQDRQLEVQENINNNLRNINNKLRY